MLRILKLLRESKIVKSFEILDFKSGKDFYFFKIKVVLVDFSELYVREYVSEDDHLYSYHWQDKNGKLRIRWDNAPHHKHIKTFPHHMHAPNVKESSEVDLGDVLKVIEGKIILGGYDEKGVKSEDV